MKQEDNKIHILLADDDLSTRRLFGGQLVELGYETFYAKDGDECREMARRMQPDIILLDYNMPKMNGMDIAERIKSESETAHIPIIILTNEDISVEGVKALKEFGVNAYVHKGEDFQVIADTIKKSLDSAKTTSRK